MIIKELDPIETNDPLLQAGFRAESQLAFYLKREFKDDPLFLIFNNLRFEKAGDACQIDHLVLHRYGMIIIESKSVTTRVEVNELGEWKRWFNNAWQGMPSPILQAQRQGKFIKDYLESNVETLLNKVLFTMQSHFTKMPIDVLVAISDSGIINRPKNDKLNNVCKADQIPDKVREIVSEYRKIDSLLTFSLKSAYLFDMDEVPRISVFLLANHTPLKVKAKLNDVSNTPITSTPISSPVKNPSISKPITTDKPVSQPKKIIPITPNKHQQSDISHKPIIKTAKPTSTNTCSHCQSPNLLIAYVHSYFFKCNDCGKNTAIKNICTSCGDRAKIRKSGLQFFSECEKCGNSQLFHTNPSTNR
ncbi:nuclease-related domain-containing protein [Phormidium tenue]|uniref:NERD domain-containing protein n=1 Tax=Phormidium tenue FACHB-1050 TaxID=2692857 RepID=A0ABR8CE08_9CYAN|nr:nuclease-related domain-containing protein [Phormidium tenue]MBD2318345.1 NERD domain-containing protein [Phormidium tenue FACHB-1050]